MILKEIDLHPLSDKRGGHHDRIVPVTRDPIGDVIGFEVVEEHEEIVDATNDHSSALMQSNMVFN